MPETALSGVYINGDCKYVLRRQPEELPLLRGGEEVCKLEITEYAPRLLEGSLIGVGSRRLLSVLVETEPKSLPPGPIPRADKTLIRESLECGGFVFKHSRAAYSWGEVLDDALWNRRMASLEKKGGRG